MLLLRAWSGCGILRLPSAVLERHWSAHAANLEIGIHRRIPKPPGTYYIGGGLEPLGPYIVGTWRDRVFCEAGAGASIGSFLGSRGDEVGEAPKKCSSSDGLGFRVWGSGFRV